MPEARRNVPLIRDRVMTSGSAFFVKTRTRCRRCILSRIAVGADALGGPRGTAQNGDRNLRRKRVKSEFAGDRCFLSVFPPGRRGRFPRRGKWPRSGRKGRDRRPLQDASRQGPCTAASPDLSLRISAAALVWQSVLRYRDGPAVEIYRRRNDTPARPATPHPPRCEHRGTFPSRGRHEKLRSCRRRVLH